MAPGPDTAAATVGYLLYFNIKQNILQIYTYTNKLYMVQSTSWAALLAGAPSHDCLTAVACVLSAKHYVLVWSYLSILGHT